MKLIVAYIKPVVLERVIAALHTLPAVTGATICEARGFGRGRSNDGTNEEDVLGTSDRVRLEIAVDDSEENMVVSTLRTMARTGLRGDGKILVLPLSAVVPVRNGGHRG